MKKRHFVFILLAMICILSLSCDPSGGSSNSGNNSGYVPSPPGSIGGSIFYVDGTSVAGASDGTITVDGVKYRFKKANGSSVGNLSGITSAGVVLRTDTLAAAASYEIVSGTPSHDAFYVLNENAVIGTGRTGTQSNPRITWTYYDTTNQSYIDNADYRTVSNVPSGKQGYEYLGYKGRVYESLFGTQTSNAFGTGRQNTANMLSLRGGCYVQGAQPRFKGDSYSYYGETVWYICKNFNQGTYSLKTNSTGKNDWFIPSKDEQTQIRAAFGAGTDGLALYNTFAQGDTGSYTYSYAWSSSARSDVGFAWNRYADTTDGSDYADDHYRDNCSDHDCLVLIRAF